MPDDDRPQITLITPPRIDLITFPDLLAAVLDRVAVACLRHAATGGDEDQIAREADALREVAHARDVAIVIDRHVVLAERLGLDGVHLLDGTRSIRAARKALGQDAIVGAFCGVSRHDGMTAAEMGADYVAFGPAGETALGTGAQAPRDLFQWWSEMIEVPVIAEGALTPTLIRDLASVTDFFAFGPEVWGADDPAAALAALDHAIG
jgi:thiamine-phosphate pyrophosphorylase